MSRVRLALEHGDLPGDVHLGRREADADVLVHRLDHVVDETLRLGASDLGATTVASFARLPVLALPLGLSSQNSPLGVQILAAPGAEDLLVSVGELLAEMAL